MTRGLKDPSSKEQPDVSRGVWTRDATRTVSYGEVSTKLGRDVWKRINADPWEISRHHGTIVMREVSCVVVVYTSQTCVDEGQNQNSCACIFGLKKERPWRKRPESVEMRLVAASAAGSATRMLEPRRCGSSSGILVGFVADARVLDWTVR